MKPIAYINVEKRTLEFAEPIKWHTPTVANLDRIPLFTKEALAQPEQEPVAYLTRRKIGGTEGLLRADMVDRSAKNQETHDFIPLYTTPPQSEQEPAALETLLKWDDEIDPIGEVVGFIEGSPYIMVKVHDTKQVSLNDDLYATPPQRTWQGLTDEDISEIVRGTHNPGSFVRAIEANLKERNT